MKAVSRQQIGSVRPGYGDVGKGVSVPFGNADQRRSIGLVLVEPGQGTGRHQNDVGPSAAADAVSGKHDVGAKPIDGDMRSPPPGPGMDKPRLVKALIVETERDDCKVRLIFARGEVCE